MDDIAVVTETAITGRDGAARDVKPAARRERSRERSSGARAGRDDESRGRRNRSRSRSRSRSRDFVRNVTTRRVYVSNIPYEYRWQEVKDLFRQEIGEVTFVELFNDEDKKPRGCGIIEFASIELTKKALEKMHRFEVQNRRLVVKEDFDTQRDECGRIVRGGGAGGGGGGGGMGGGGGGGGRNDEGPPRGRRWNSPPRGGPMMGGGGRPGGRYGNTHGLSAEFLESLGIDGPLVSKVFVANLDFRVDEKKLREVFRLAGRVFDAEINRDKDGKSRGFGVVEFEHPVEAVQAISMLSNQTLYDRRMTVRLDRVSDPGMPPRLPEGLKSLGMGLGTNGKPLVDVARNLPSNPGILNMESGLPAAVSAQLSRLGNASLTSALAPNLTAGLGLGGLGDLAGLSSSSLAANLGGGLSGALGAEALLRNAAAMPNLQSALAAAAASGAAAQANQVGNLSNLANLSGLGNSSPFGSNVGQGGGMSGGYSRGGMSDSNQSQLTALSNARSAFSRDPMSGNDSGMSGGGRGMGSGMGSGLGSLSSPPTNNPVYQTQLGGHGSHTGQGGSSSGGNLPNDNDYRGGNTSYSNGGAGTTSGSRGGARDTVLVSNLSNDCTWQMLKDKFSTVGEVRYTEMAGRGSGLVRFALEADADRAIRLLDHTRFNGGLIELRYY